MIVKVVLRTSIAGITSGITLAIARVIGETAPLLVTVGPHDVHLRQRDRRAAPQQQAHAQGRHRRAGRAVAAGANLWNEVKDRLDKPGSGLSGGQQQRLCIARAIAVQPDVLLMDEPCSALDPISTLAIEDLINELNSEYTIVIVTHNMQQAARVSDYTGFFTIEGTGKPGHLVEMDVTKTMFSNPNEKATEDYVSGALRLERQGVRRLGR